MKANNYLLKSVVLALVCFFSVNMISAQNDIKVNQEEVTPIICDDVVIYPNPMTPEHTSSYVGFEVIQRVPVTIYLLDSEGNFIGMPLTPTPLLPGYYEFPIQRGDLQPGVYFVLIDYRAGNCTKQLIIQ